MNDSAPLVLAVTADLMLQTRLGAPIAALGARLITCEGLQSLHDLLASEHPAVAVVDLPGTAVTWRDALETLRGAGYMVRVLGFFPHVMKELGVAAEQAGYDMVVPRSRFLMDPAGTIATLLGEARQSKP